MTSGIHHVTLITGNVQANVDFYVGFLGLRLVKRTGGYEDPRQLHLFYGDRSGTPGSLITFLVWQDGSPGRSGAEQVGEISFSIGQASIGFWLERTLRHQVKVEGTAQEFGETVLRLRDPDGVIIKLAAAGLPPLALPVSDIPPEHAISRLRGVTLLSETPEQTAAFITAHFGFRMLTRSGASQRLVADSGDSVDVRDASGFWPGAPGTGIADHVAFRAPDDAAVKAVERDLARLNSSLTNLHDRHYFTSLYVREPGGVLIELASDGPGFTLDEPEETLGQQLFVPPDAALDAQDIIATLPQFALPGEDRVVYRDLTHVHRFHTPAHPDGHTLLLLHGTGGNETDLMPLARRAAPNAVLLGLRGRSTESGVQRWFRGLAPHIFDQKDIAFESGALDAFITDAEREYGLDRDRLTALGYSNGANLLAAALFLHPGLVRRAILLRPVMVLDNTPQADLTGTDVLIILGQTDAYHSGGETLADALRAAGATVTVKTLPAAHALSDQDDVKIAAWLGKEAQ